MKSQKWMKMNKPSINNFLIHLQWREKSRFHFVCECAVKHWIEASWKEKAEICTVWLYSILSSFFWGFAISSTKFMTLDVPSNYFAIFDTFLSSRSQEEKFISLPLLTSCRFILQNQFILMSQTVSIFNSILTWQKQKFIIVLFG